MRHYRVIGLLDIKPNDKGGFVADNTATRKLAGVAEQVEKGLAQLREIGLQFPRPPAQRTSSRLPFFATSGVIVDTTSWSMGETSKVSRCTTVSVSMHQRSSSPHHGRTVLNRDASG
jgi:hypothetical protein